MNSTESQSILTKFNYPVFGSEYCNIHISSCPGGLQCWNFDHHIIEVKSFLRGQRQFRYDLSVCQHCFFQMYIDLARCVYFHRTGLRTGFFIGAFDLYKDLYEHFHEYKNPNNPFGSHFFVTLFDKVSKFIQIHSPVHYWHAVVVNVLFYNIIDCWMKCSPKHRYAPHIPAIFFVDDY